MQAISTKKIIFTTLIILIAVTGIGTSYASDLSISRITFFSDRLSQNSEAVCEPPDDPTKVSPCVCMGTDNLLVSAPDIRGYPFQATYIGACGTDEKSGWVFALNDAIWISFAVLLFYFLVLKPPLKTSSNK